MFHHPPEGFDRAGHACLSCGRGAASALSPVPALPGDMGSDLLLEHADGGLDEFRVAAALSRPYVRCTGEGVALICRPDDPLWMAAHEGHPEAGLAFGGLCRFRRPECNGGLWRLSIPQAGTVTGRFTLHVIPGNAPDGGNGTHYEFRAIGAPAFSH